MPPSDLVLFRNIGLSDTDTSGQTSTVGEPSLGNNGGQLFLTGNWYAAKSLDNGAAWSFVDPFNLLPPANGGFCCDQTVIYDPSRDLTFWLLQYIEDGSTNTLRVAVKVSNSLSDDSWYWYDFRPDTVDPDWDNEWFDYNHAALGNNHLYVASNAFSTIPGGGWTRSVLLRLPLDQMAAGEALDYHYFQSTSNFSLRCVQGARGVMHFASHNSNSEIRVFSWSEETDTIHHWDVGVTPWSAGSYSAPGPDGNNWLSRCDPRITGGWVADGKIGFMWTANSRSGRPFPHVRVVRLDERTKALIDEPDIWSPDLAYAYPDACPNDRGHVGVTLFRGGGSHHPGHVVGVADDYSSSWTLQATRNGTDGPGDGKWGDYLACRRHSPDGLTWIASGFTLQGGSHRTDIEPRVVHFGRARDTAAVSRWDDA